METNLPIVAAPTTLPVFTFNDAAKQAKEQALEVAALIGKVSDANSKVLAVRAQQALKRCLLDIESARKKLKEPLLQAGRQLDTLCAKESLALDQEFGRVSHLVKEFDDEERRRVLEEQRIQREDLEKIEREKQAEIKRLADEQAAREAEARRLQEEADRKVREAKERADREAREAQEAAQRLANEAKNKKQREAAEKARKEAESQAKARRDIIAKQEEDARMERERREAELAQQAQELAIKTAQVEEQAGDDAYAAARPIEITRVAGQRSTTDWEITVEQPFILAKFHPDLVNITARLADIKAALNDGREIKGIKATKVTKASVRVGPAPKAIDV